MLTDWQIAIIVLLLFALAFGFLATMMAIGGVCVTSLSRKVYYYHSAGEIFVISGESQSCDVDKAKTAQ